MSLTYDILLNHIINFLIYLSCTPSFWFLLNTSYDHGCHLASQFQSGGDGGKVGGCGGRGGGGGDDGGGGYWQWQWQWQ
jgi:uncharacterized membrane protein YgcG